MPASPVHHTATSNATWNGPAAVAAMPNDKPVLTYCHAWHEDGAGDEKAGYKFPHHTHKGGPAVLAGVRNGLARLSGANVDDKDGIKAHLQAHLDDGTSSDDDGDSHSAVHVHVHPGAVGNPAQLSATLRAALRAGRGGGLLPAPGARGVARARLGRGDRMKLRAGGILSRGGAAGGRLTLTEQAALDGEPLALRALVRQAVGVNMLTIPTTDIELRAAPTGTGGSRLMFTGYASLTEYPFEMWDFFGAYTENLHSGAFTRTLGMQPDVIKCLNHDWDSAPMARTIPAGSLVLHEDSLGLLTEAALDPSRADVAILASAIEGGELGAMSFAFWATQQSWSPDYDQRDIHEVDIDGGDVATVTHPANPGTDGTVGLRRRQVAALASTQVPALLVQRARMERRQAGELTPATRVVLQAVLDLVLAADTAVDLAMPMLAELLGVENPDEAQDAALGGDDGDAGSDDGAAASAGTGMGMSLARMRLREDARRAAGG